MSKIRKLMGFASAFAFIIAMLPALAFAETTQYNLLVNGEQFTSDNLTLACGEGRRCTTPARGLLR